MDRSRQQRYERTPRGQYAQQKATARKRGVPFELTFDQWWAIWQESGLWKCRGAYAGGAVMMRTNDKGPYAVGNVRIGSFIENVAERNRLMGVRKRHERRVTTVLFD